MTGSSIGKMALFVAIGLITLISIPIVFPSFRMGRAGPEAKRLACQNNLRAICIEVRYELEYGRMNVQEIIERLGPKLFCFSRAKVEVGLGYTFVNDAHLWAAECPDPLPLAWDSEARHGGRINVLFQGGNVRSVSEEELHGLIRSVQSTGLRRR